jgi:hypothetical protein
MRHPPLTPLVLAVGAAILAGACSDGPSTGPEEADPDAMQPVHESADPVALVRQVSGFGGFFFDRQGKPTIYLKSPAGRSAAEHALGAYLAVQGLRAADLQVRRAEFDWASLERWKTRASGATLALRGVAWVDADEARNRVTIGVERRTSAAEVRAAVARLGVPATALVVEEVEPVRQAATLRDRVRPVAGGLQINFPGFLCTLGFNAMRSGVRSFITNSHCTGVQGGAEGTPYWQPTSTGASARIATEVADPGYTRDGSCPAGRRCRRSDAARAAYASGTNSTLGRIARTTGANTGAVTISGNFTVTAEGSPVAGQTVNKVGRTTGWTRGTVTNTCVHVNVSGTNVTQLCQTLVSAGVGSGDSGSPVFRQQSGGSNVTLLGILWGGSGGSTFVFSPMANIEAELGALRTF